MLCVVTLRVTFGPVYKATFVESPVKVALKTTVLTYHEVTLVRLIPQVKLWPYQSASHCRPNGKIRLVRDVTEK